MVAVMKEASYKKYYQAIAETPKVAVPYRQLASALLEDADFEQAIAFAKIALSLNPNDFQAALLLQKSIDALHKLSYPKRPSAQAHQPAKQPPLIAEEGNNYTFISQKVQGFINSSQPYHLPVSIIIPTYNRKDKLARALAALTHQSYPQHLIEIIVADDGSTDGIETVIQKFQQHLTIKHVWQPDLGFRLAGVCNLGIQNATHNCIVLLQCDMIPRPELVEAYMQYLHTGERVFLIGGRQFVCADDITDDQILADVDAALSLPAIKTNNEIWQGQKSWQDWRIPVYQETDGLKKEKYPFRAAVGSNLAFSKQLVEEIGGFDEDFHAWGGEDREFGYRAYNAGYYFIPVKKAQCLHQEPPEGVNESDRKLGSRLAKKGCEEKCPMPTDRKYQAGRVYAVPKVSICVVVFSNADTPRLLRTSIESVLNQTYTDLEAFVIVCGVNSHRFQSLQVNFSADKRVRWKVLRRQYALESVLNGGFKRAKGAYIGYLKAGDTLRPDEIERLNQRLDEGDDGCAFEEAIAQPFQLFRKRDWMRAQ